jgi:hypothetical protein
MLRGWMGKGPSDEDIEWAKQKALDLVGNWLERFDAVVIGPGLGRDPLVHSTVRSVARQLPRSPASFQGLDFHTPRPLSLWLLPQYHKPWFVVFLSFILLVCWFVLTYFWWAPGGEKLLEVR